ncbi:MAG: choice-of-anchor D domain-containing protein [Sodaliphilus sp.]
MTIDVSSLNMNSTADAPEAKATFNIGNDDDGILKWEAYKRTVSMTTSSVSRPVVGNVQPYSGTIAGEVVKRSPSSTASPEYLADDYPKNINYYSQLWAYIGDEDRSLPNSMAQWFKVDADAYPNGFNLTHINVDGDGSRSLGTKPLVQIYKGDAAISSATCIAEVTPSFFAYNYPIALPEQLYFAPGESFWIVLHFDGNLEVYPLSMGTATSETVAQYSYMSNDKGKTWTQLAQALKGSVYESQANQMAWTITARSNNPDWSEMLELNPVSGTVLKGESQPVEVSADGSKLVNGTYKLKLHLTSNEGNGETEHQLPITYKVAGNNPDIIGPKIVNFGSLLVGESKTIEVEVFNRGYGRFAGSRYSAGLYTNNISSSSPHFSGPSSIQTGFPARATVKFNLTYTPTEAGTHTGTITFTDYLGNKANIVVQGVATEPAKLVITPSEVECDTLIVGEPDVQKSFTISNAGKYPLEFVFPKFSSETIEGQSAKLHQFGYTVSSTLQGYNPFAYDGNPELIGATDIASQFTDNNVVSSAINLGFAFPYYGKTYEKAYITSFGGLMFAPNELTFRTPLSPTSESIRGTGLISAYGQQVWMGPQSRVEYAKVDGKFVVKFINVLATVYGDDTTPISFHISLSSNGDIEIYYDDYVADNVFQQGVGLFCGINDPEVADEVTITSADQGDYWGYDEPTEENQRYHSFATGTAVKFEAPKASFVRSLNIPSAIVNPGESVEVVATVGADASLNAGATFNNLAIVTNDPNPDFSFVRFNAVIDGAELTPVAALEKESIDLGKVFRTSVQKVPVTVKNTGHRALTVNSVAVSDAEKLQFNSTDFSPVDIEPGMSKDFIVTVATNNEGVVEGQVTTSTTGGNLNCSIKAEVIGCPEIAIAPDHITDTVASGTPVSQSVSITNNGNETLRYSIAPDQLVSLTLPEKADAVTSYAYRFSGDDSSVKFKWEDIETNGLGEQRTLSYYMAHDYVAVDLPFEFPFYGQKYNKMYIYNTGFVSFTERHDDAIWPEPPAEFPQGTVYTNIIAPYWGLHSMDQTKTAGTFHYVTDDRAVISFIEYGNSMNIGVDYQLILEKDGSFRFQYKGASNEAIIFAPFGLAGISNVDGSEGIRLPERMLKFDNAVEFTPVVELPLAAGQTDKVTIDVDTKRMAGNYSTDLKITTNVPGSENLTFPVNVEITGTAVPQWPNDTIIEHVIGYQSTDYSDPLVQMGAMYNAPVIVKNAGTAPFTIDYVQMTAPQVYDEWFEEYVDVFVLFANVEQEDWFTGEIVKSWTHYPGQPITVGEEPAEFAVPMNQCNFAYTPGEYDIKLTFMCNQDTDSAFTKDVHVKYIVTPAPSLALDKEQIYVKATKETDKFNEKVKLSNEFGDYKLTYSLTLDPTGVGEQVDNGGIGGADPWSAIQANTVKMKADTSACALNQSAFVQPMANNVYVDVPNDFEYRNALYYPAAPYETMTYNYGSGNTYDVFKEAVAFTAPEEGFNLSHIYFAVSAGGVNDYPVDFDIVTGSTPGQGDVIGHGQYIDTGGSTTGKLVVVPLSKPVYLNPGEEFHVQVTYGVGNKYPAYVCPKEEAVVPGRYMGWVESAGWFDVAELFREQYGSLGFVLTCLETTEGEPWVKLLTPASNAVVEAGDTTNIEVAINAASARLEKNNKAMLVIKSNDPNQPVINFPIILDKNGTPVIATPEGIVYAKEGEDTNVAITINDPDNDDLTIAFNDPNGNAVVSSIDAGTATVAGENGVYTITGVDGVVAVNVVISPKYGSASEGNVFNITATDANGLSAEASVRYDIEHVNRAPVAIEPSPAEVNIEDLSCVYRFADYFTDPDGDEMTYSFNLAANDIVDAYPNATGVVFFGKKVGTVTATLTATDAQGATASVAWPIVVIDASGIADITNDDSFRVTPNPVDGDINVYTDFNASNVSFSLYDAAGHIVFNITADCAPGSATVLPGDSLANGIYILTATTSDGIIRATRIVKK